MVMKFAFLESQLYLPTVPSQCDSRPGQRRSRCPARAGGAILESLGLFCRSKGAC